MSARVRASVSFCRIRKKKILWVSSLRHNFYSQEMKPRDLFYGTQKRKKSIFIKWKEDKKATDKLSAEIKLLQVKEVEPSA